MLGVQEKKRVFLFSTIHASFIEKDYQILKKYFVVHRLTASGLKAVLLIFWNILFCDVVFCWFGSVYSGISVLIGRLFGKRTIIILGGVDVAKEDEFDYGIWLTKWKQPFVKLAIRMSERVLVVDPSLGIKAKQLVGYNGLNIQYLPTGYESNFWYPSTSKMKVVLTVAHCDTLVRLKKKGIDYLFQAAKRMSDIPFFFIGAENKLLENAGFQLPENMTLLPRMTQTELRGYYQRAAVFCQPSRSEGLPNTLCEAMACGCIPVGTDVDGIPTAIGDTGFVVPLGDMEALVDSLKHALKMNVSQGQLARQRIINEFPLQRRVDGLRKAVLGIACE